LIQAFFVKLYGLGSISEDLLLGSFIVSVAVSGRITIGGYGLLGKEGKTTGLYENKQDDQ
jgi:hypothetical protein